MNNMGFFHIKNISFFSYYKMEKALLRPGVGKLQPEGQTTNHVFEIKFYWNTTTSIHLSIVSGCFCFTMIESNSCDGDLMACKA